MKAPSFPTGTAAFHALALAFFGGCAGALFLEAGRLAGNQRLLERVVAGVSVLLALLALRALVMLIRARTAVPLRSRAFGETYFQVLVGVGVLGVAGLRLGVIGGRPALVTFCAGTALWLLLLGFHFVPALLLVRDAFIDHLGKRTRFTDLEWFSLQTAPAIGDEPPRTLLRVGRGREVRIQARLVTPDAEGVRKALTAAGLSASPPRS
jgi:hypothetical protein